MHHVTAAKTIPPPAATSEDFLFETCRPLQGCAQKQQQLITQPCLTNWLSPLWTPLRKRKKINKNLSNTKLCLHEKNETQTLTPWIGEWGWRGGRPGFCSVPKKPKHFLFGPDIHTKHGAELPNVGGTIEDSFSDTAISGYDAHLEDIQVFFQKNKKKVVYKKCSKMINSRKHTSLRYTVENVDSTNFRPEGVKSGRIWISPPSFFYGKDWSQLHRASHMEEIYPICLAQQDSQLAAPQFTSI